MKDKLAILVAIVLGVVATLAIWVHLQRIETSVLAKGRPVEVVIAKTALAPGDKFSPDRCDFAEVPAQFVELTRDAVLKADLRNYVDRVVALPVQAGQLLLTHHFAGAESYAPLELQPGQRAVSVFVDQVTGVGGHLRPRQYVDVLATFDALPLAEAAGLPTARTVVLLQRALVLATGATAGEAGAAYDPGTGYATVTLAVSVKDAELLTFAQQYGKLALVYRDRADTDIESTPSVGMKQILEKLKE